MENVVTDAKHVESHTEKNFVGQHIQRRLQKDTSLRKKVEEIGATAEKEEVIVDLNHPEK